ncbi:MAG: hypothetical protein RDA78_19750 [Roseibium sp.]|uniref:hypothetical protein n=1 Tax=Roseibium sp. TaxID=1936156 RepID=UPI003D9BFECC
MAVTQQLARLFPSRFERCRRDVSELDRLLSFELEPDEACIDLDWSAASLLKGFEALGDAETLRLLAEALGEGAGVVNIDYPTGPTDYCVYSAITAVNRRPLLAYPRN